MSSASHAALERLERQCEELDAEIFSGKLSESEQFTVIKGFVARWAAAIEAQEAEDRDDAGQQDQAGWPGLSDADMLRRWEGYRAEVAGMERRMARLAGNFLGLGDYEGASRCAIKAESMRFVQGRMPPLPSPPPSPPTSRTR